VSRKTNPDKDKLVMENVRNILSIILIILQMESPKGVFKEAERFGLQEKHRINIRNKLGGASIFFNRGGEL